MPPWLIAAGCSGETGHGWPEPIVGWTHVSASAEDVAPGTSIIVGNSVVPGISTTAGDSKPTVCGSVASFFVCFRGEEAFGAAEVVPRTGPSFGSPINFYHCDSDRRGELKRGAPF